MFVESFARDFYTPGDPTYSVTPDATEANEGATVNFAFQADNVRDGALFTWEVVSEKVSAQDFDDGAMAGAFSVANWAGSFTRTLKNDLSFEEGPEPFSVRVHSGSILGPVVATSTAVMVFDTSVEPESYQVAPSALILRSGGTVTFDVVTSGVPSGRQVQWQKLSGTAVAGDFVTPLSGVVEIQNRRASFSLTVADTVTALRTLAVCLTDGANVLAESLSIAIYPPPSITPKTVSVYEGV
ncbi:hypothetical protein Cenrod_1571 [Candidatus Symbiobacter mobilis CR]|uniref:Uncharacterized protein n=2 Tax=Candidatus Symbiobacter TaxID=1436289 RepID=U5N7X1_9BURK|nr:hypothetical protein Cenrod_1571 [Candidatus Symbiobacter mobilis CR]